MSKSKNFFHPDEPLKHPDHRRPKTRREFLSQGFTTGMGTVMGASSLSLLSGAAHSQVELSDYLDQRREECGILPGAGKIPFIAFDLAGGANIAGSNVLVGGAGGPMDFLSTAGYSKQGLPGDMIPGLQEMAVPDPDATGNNDFTDTSLGLAFHSDSAMLKGILEKASIDTRALVNGAVIPARSENDTANNPHNPMYGISLMGANGQLLPLVGSRTSESGGNSMAPESLINNEVRPTKIDRPSDVTGLVNVGSFGDLTETEVVAVMESVSRVSSSKMDNVRAYLEATNSTRNMTTRENVNCAYIKSAYLAALFPDPAVLNPIEDPDITGADPIFTREELQSGDREFQKTASVMKLVIEGKSGAGTIAMGGYDYHTGDRATGEMRDLRVGRCIGACLEYARRKGTPVMIYVFSDGSVFSNGMTDDSEGGRGKGVWTGDNQQTASSFFLVFDPRTKPALKEGSTGQVGYMRSSGDVETSSSPCANNVNLLVNTVVLNYMALHGGNSLSKFETAYGGVTGGHGLGSAASMDRLTMFDPIQSIRTNAEGEQVIDPTV